MAGCRASAASLGVALFFGFWGCGWTEEPVAPQVEELRLLLDQVRADKARLQHELEHREQVIKLLTENLAIARTESELFQKKWAEARLRAQSLGVDFSDPKDTLTQRQLVESVRALYLAEAERERFGDQLKQLMAAVQTNGDVTAEVARTHALLAATEHAEKPVGKTTGSVYAAEVLEINPSLRLAVLNVGADSGARVGMPFAVVRDDRVVAKLKVVEVRRRICGAVIERVDKGVTLTAGDAARVTQE